MAELPDLEVFIRNSNKLFAGKKLKHFKIVVDKKFKESPGRISGNYKGKILKDVYRNGKELRL